MEIRNPTGGDDLIVTHGPGQFSGDMDLLTGRPVIVKAVARGANRVLRVPNSHLRTLLNRVPSLGEKLIAALTRRRELLSNMGTVGLALWFHDTAARRTRFASSFTRTSSPLRGSTRTPRRARTC